ncbi:MAG: Aerotaxis receptor [Alphaproteobacteria bacterium ADurb.Bin438]|nr:MAG: Aerotaxis receptor [Alphaproteobacteria bacterium ADurb.Bin438]
MSGPKTQITNKERFFDEGEMIVTKTNKKGVLTYANDIFINISDYTEDELIGQQHNVIRHPHMPRTIFKLLWSTIESGHEIFAYVKNRCKDGDHYWVFAHVTPSFDDKGNIIGYHSNRRVPNRKVLDNVIIPLYKKLLEEEQKQINPKEGIEAGMRMLNKMLEEKNMEYDEFIFSLLK